MMKFRAIPVFAAAAMLSLAACGGSGEGEAETGDTTAVENAAPEAPPAMGPDTLAPAMGTDTGTLSSLVNQLPTPPGALVPQGPVVNLTEQEAVARVARTCTCRGRASGVSTWSDGSSRTGPSTITPTPAAATS